MSAGGQRGIDVSGITGIRIQNASDFVKVKQTQLMYQNFASTTGANAYANRTPNGYNYYLQFIEGTKEVGRTDISGANCVTCTGLPYQYSKVMTFRT